MRRARAAAAPVGVSAVLAVGCLLLGPPSDAVAGSGGGTTTAVPTTATTQTATATVTTTATRITTATTTTTTGSASPTTTARPVAGTPTRRPVTTPTPTPSPAPDPAPPRTDDSPLTPAEVRAQLAQAAALAAQRRATDAALQAVTEQLQDLGRQTATALDRLAEARRDELTARQALRTSARQLTSLRGHLGASRDEVGQWARDTYSMGGAMAAYEGWLVALEADSTADVARSLATLEHLGVTGAATVRRLERSVSGQTRLTRQAELAAGRARAASARTSAAVVRLRLLRQRATAVAARLRGQQLRRLGADRFSAQQRANLTSAEALLAAAGATGVGAAGCPGRDTSRYRNGAIPAMALCPVWGAPGHLLRADAAAAMSALSRDHAAELGRPLCLTDSYRTLAVQVRLKASKPRLAARPGTSNHGWATAVDLCGGVQSFGTPEHAWMLAHAPLRGWFHPAWAGPSGSKPEPWHWEFAG